MTAANTTTDNLIYLLGCAIKNEKADAARVSSMDLSELYRLSRSHMVTSAVAYALESAGVKDDNFVQAKAKAQRKTALMDADMTVVIGELEAAGIWHMPLKGAILKDLYPGFGMRQMSDRDILVDPDRMADVKKIMLSAGFKPAYVGQGEDDSYHKAPVSNFEMHHRLFGATHDSRLEEYYKDVKSRLIKNEGDGYGYHFSSEDFYIYLLAHEYKHYSAGGVGIRSLSDTYLYLKKYGNDLDFEYIASETEKLGIGEFEELNRRLSLALFDGASLDEEEERMYRYMLGSGTYGNLGNSFRNKIKKQEKKRFPRLAYIWRRVFLPLSVVKSVFPVFYKYPILLPFLPFYRLIRGLLFNRKRLKNEAKLLRGYKRK